jgi:hypothetical protein
LPTAEKGKWAMKKCWLRITGDGHRKRTPNADCACVVIKLLAESRQSLFSTLVSSAATGAELAAAV